MRKYQKKKKAHVCQCMHHLVYDLVYVHLLHLLIKKSSSAHKLQRNNASPSGICRPPSMCSTGISCVTWESHLFHRQQCPMTWESQFLLIYSTIFYYIDRHWVLTSALILTYLAHLQKHAALFKAVSHGLPKLKNPASSGNDRFAIFVKMDHLLLLLLFEGPPLPLPLKPRRMYTEVPGVRSFFRQMRLTSSSVFLLNRVTFAMTRFPLFFAYSFNA